MFGARVARPAVLGVYQTDRSDRTDQPDQVVPDPGGPGDPRSCLVAATPLGVPYILQCTAPPLCIRYAAG